MEMDGEFPVRHRFPLKNPYARVESCDAFERHQEPYLEPPCYAVIIIDGSSLDGLSHTLSV